MDSPVQAQSYTNSVERYGGHYLSAGRRASFCSLVVEKAIARRRACTHSLKITCRSAQFRSYDGDFARGLGLDRPLSRFGLRESENCARAVLAYATAPAPGPDILNDFERSSASSFFLASIASSMDRGQPTRAPHSSPKLQSWGSVMIDGARVVGQQSSRATANSLYLYVDFCTNPIFHERHRAVVQILFLLGRHFVNKTA